MRRLALLVALAGIMAAGTARAQSMAVSGSVPSDVGGAGISLGERLVLHLGISAELRYDSNVFYEDTNPTRALELRIVPQFLLTTRTKSGAQHRVDFHLGGNLQYNEFLVANTSPRPPRQFNVGATTGLTILPVGPVTLDLYDNFNRTVQPPYQKSTINYDRDVNEVGFRLRIKPGGGRLEAQLGFGFGIDLWESTAQQPYNNFYYHSTARILYKFLPKTSVYVAADDTAYQYRDSSTTLTPIDRPNGEPLRVIAGLNGLLTPKLTFDIFGGYENGFYKQETYTSGGVTVKSPNPNTGTAGLTITWKVFALANASLAYRHDFENTLVGVYANYDNVAVSWTQQIWRFSAYLRLAYQNTRYEGVSPLSGIVATDGTDTSTFTTNDIIFNARVSYFTYKNWLALYVGYDLNYLTSNSALKAGSTNAAAIIPTDFTKHEVYLGAQLNY